MFTNLETFNKQNRKHDTYKSFESIFIQYSIFMNWKLDNMYIIMKL